LPVLELRDHFYTFEIVDGQKIYFSLNSIAQIAEKIFNHIFQKEPGVDELILKFGSYLYYKQITKNPLVSKRTS
jgi:hypothetical protein